MITIKNFINGQFLDAQSSKTLPNTNPAIGQVFSTIPDSDSADVEMAIQAAKAAFPAWKNISQEKRFMYITKIADLIEKNLEKFVEAETTDNGKTLNQARTVDIPRAISNLRFFASAQWNFAGESYVTPNMGLNYTLRQPLGVVGCISPWNLPLYLFTWKIAPALAAGNTVVAKPSEITPYTAFLFCEMCKEAGLPDGVINVIHGLGASAGNPIVAHPEVKAIAFTGGTQTGRHINKIAAEQFKKVSLELGGKNPNIIFADCDMEEALTTTIRSSFSNQGQICLCGSRIFIERSIYDQFKNQLVERAKLLTIGDPLSDVNLGAMVSETHMNKVLACIDTAVQEGGNIVLGGKRKMMDGRCKDGYFIEPTIIDGLSHMCSTNQEEIFGPVVTLTPFDTEEEVIAMANSTKYGLACSLWTQNIQKAHRIAEQIESGLVWINTWMVRDLRTPFGGVKSSGVGREGGFEAMRFFTEAKNVFVKY